MGPGHGSTTPGLTLPQSTQTSESLQALAPPTQWRLSTGPQHLREIRVATSAYSRRAWTGMGLWWRGSGHAGLGVPALFKSCFSTWTSHSQINPYQLVPPPPCRYLMTQDMDPHGGGGSRGVPQGGGRGVVEGGGESGFRQVLATTWFAPVMLYPPQAAHYLYDPTGTMGVEGWVSSR